MIENERVLTGCDTCDYGVFNGESNSYSCSLDSSNYAYDGCSKYKMKYTYFCQNHAQFDKYTGLVKDLKWDPYIYNK
jgi:hypothetical protein